MFEYIKSWFVSPPVSPVIKAEVQNLIDSNKILIFSKSYCPYCDSTKDLIKSITSDFKVVELNTSANGRTIQDALREMTGQNTVPNIFINRKHIGGNSDLQALQGAGKLKSLVN
ncbi:DEHA2D03410p [Debaryomyces hansenii CBS767]|uniref:DEHA2D03410p n=1 Tax=Debaryomyces hansenii (strain ATCC 36239 / CBS 767 / BCRC 21394 / JCM 1990 / NBRC 0083 / IGC 2968) TaxID=284592 RepID=Q6BT54_DEBHA|nr:DEHA2D03410p [Debaryomyces hansenii CBS767]CAG86752.2 DEHA2D03410p [Debaryomyces hansenii CBS767]|eukprot:XP_458616.2 DEHA2D03410p [Debaryomyces hansenii CBS767]